MTHIGKVLAVIALLLTLCVFSCKKIGKKVGKEFAEEVIEKSAKNASEDALEKIGKKELKNLNWSDFYRNISKSKPSIGKAIDEMDGVVQESFEKAIKKDYRFFHSLTSSNTVLDECKVFYNQAPTLSKDPNFIRMFVKSDIVRREGRPCLLNELIAKEERGMVKFVNSKTRELVADYKDGLVKVYDKSFLKQELIPNACYKLESSNGKKILYNIDDLGRISSVDARNISPNELVEDIMNFNGKCDFGVSWEKALKKLKQTSKTDDINAKCVFKYNENDEVLPKYADLKAAINGKEKISSTYKNSLKRLGNTFSATENRTIVEKYASKLKMSLDKIERLVSEMNSDDGLARLIQEDPEFNIRRWLNTRNHVDKSAIIRNPKGQLPRNASTYAGNTYYFHPSLNSKLKSRLIRNNGVVNLKTLDGLSYDDLIKLDKLYPDGVPFGKNGFPDFSKVAQKGKDGLPIKINIGVLSGDSKKDISKAETIFQSMGNKWEEGYTWHHIENSTELLRVPTIIHQLVDHDGGMSMSRTVL